jgi:hypothetical protein
MPRLRFEPIATQLAKLASSPTLFPADTLDRIRRGEAAEGVDPRWSREMKDFMLHYKSVVRAGYLLLGARPFERLGRLHDELEETYQPGGPPDSPVYDSYSVQHVLGEIPQGLARETPYTVLARLSSSDPARARLHELAQSLALSHLDLYRVERASSMMGEVVPLRGGAPFSVHLTGPFLQEGDRVLARILAFGEQRFIADSPYLVEAPEGDWLAYFERIAQQPDHDEPPPTIRDRPTNSAALTPKQAARRRKKQTLEAAQNTPHARVTSHLRLGKSDRYWLDYIMAGYAGERRGIVRLAGVPDRPQSLPHRDFSHYSGLADDSEDGPLGGDDVADDGANDVEASRRR